MKKEIENFLVYLVSRNYSNNTIKSYESDLKEYSEQFDTLDDNNINTYILKLKDKGEQAVTIRRKISTLRQFARFLKKDINLDLKFKIERKIPTYLEPKEFKKMLKATTNIRDKLILETLFYTGIRISELKDLIRGIEEGSGGKIKINGKGNKERYVFLPGHLYRKLLKLKNQTGGLFINKYGNTLSTRYINKIISRIARKVKLNKRVSAHTFRHSLATYFLNKGGSLRALQEILGHASIATTQIYTHLATKDLENEYNRTIKRV